MDLDRKIKIRYKTNIKKYLNELRVLLGRDVDESELLSLDESQIVKLSSKEVILDFSFKIKLNSEERFDFDDLFKSLKLEEDDQLLLWSTYADDCGYLKLNNFNQFNDIKGVLYISDICIFISKKNRLLIDYRVDGDTKEIIFEVNGYLWGAQLKSFFSKLSMS